MSKVSTNYKLYDFVFPGGKVVKLCKVQKQSDQKDLQNILQSFKLSDGNFVVMISGAKNDEKYKQIYAGIARACQKTDAVIIDKGLSSGVEQHSFRRGVKLIGVAPECQVSIENNQEAEIDKDVSQNHTHCFLTADKVWGEEVDFKFQLSQSQGSKYKCKQMLLFFGDNVIELKKAIESNFAVIVVSGSDTAQELIGMKKGGLPKNQDLNGINMDKIFILENLDSEEMASYIHFLLTVNVN